MRPVFLALILALPAADPPEPSHDGKTLTAWLEQLNDPKKAVRVDAVEAIGAMGPDAKAAVPPLLLALKRDESEEVRAAAAEALGKIGPAAEPAARGLAAVLKEDKSELVRGQAVLALGKIGKASVPYLIELLDDPDAEVRRDAAEAVEVVGPDARDAVKPLIPLLKDANGGVRIAAFGALGKIGPDAADALPRLAEFLRDPPYRNEAAAAMIGLGKASVPTFAAGVGDKDLALRRLSAFALGRIGPDARAGVPPLIEALKDMDFSLPGRLGVAGQDRAGAAGAADALLDALKKDDDPVVRTNAALALGQLSLAAKRIVGPLTDAMKDKDSEVRRRGRVARRRRGGREVGAAGAEGRPHRSRPRRPRRGA